MHVDYNKVDVCYVLEIFKTTPLKIFKQGGARPVRQRWIHLWWPIQWSLLKMYQVLCWSILSKKECVASSLKYTLLASHDDQRREICSFLTFYNYNICKIKD